MALRMVEGSVFAVLMRSPWYYSAIIAFSLISLSLMIAGGKFFLFGIAAAFPFLVILGMVAYRNAQLPSRQRIIEVDQLARKTPYRKIAHRIAVNYENARFDVEPCKDEAADLILTRGAKVFLLCSKRFKAARTGIDAFKSLVETGEKHEATGYLYVALGQVSDTAREYARQEDIEIVDAQKLAQYWDGKYKLN